jgi:hypothetical protein
LLNLKGVNNRSQLAENLVGSLVVFQLRGNKVRQVPQWFRGIKNLTA